MCLPRRRRKLALAELKRLTEAEAALEELAVEAARDNVVAKFDEFDATEKAAFRQAGAAAFEAPNTILSQLTERFAGDGDARVRIHVAEAWDQHGRFLAKCGLLDESIAAFDEVERRFGSDQEIKEMVGISLYNKGIAFRDAMRLQEAVATLEVAVRRCEGDPNLRRNLVRALFNKGIVLDAAERMTEAAETYDEVISRFGEVPDAMIQDWVSRSRAELAAMRHRVELESAWIRLRNTLSGSSSV